MRMRLDRTNTGPVGRWWWTIDRWLLLSFISLIILSAVLVAATSPPAAERLNIDNPFHFASRHYLFLPVSAVLMIVVSLFDPRTIRRLAMLGLLVTLILMVAVPINGPDTKGATRWLSLGGLTLQPSEFMKPCFVITVAWLLAERQRYVDFPGYGLVAGLYGICALLLFIQPDIGMLIMVTAVFAVQLFLSGIPWLWVIALGALASSLLLGAYLWFPHVTQRIQGFLDPASVDNYQVDKSLEAFAAGGLLGRGIGAGEVKWELPDPHTDFIYAVIGEEFGLAGALIVAGIFVVIVLRGISRAGQADDVFSMLAVSGLVIQLGLQAFINMGVSVQLLPAKGMTLPFLSYGGSSLVAIAITAGCILGLTRRRFGRLYSAATNPWSPRHDD